ncbi:DUF5615 family PIN-like protein [Aggregatilinea lenta]|uniref:DUF5615 family PIN-like protein n=1 Tax=Aggregatilinea lenta TaxID=913108 RepID=UPI000E5A96F1|nr:DUF5615 family PIN-like protein [Aggregatilinea lenta]
MKFLADMAIAQSTVTWLREQGHAVMHVRDEGMQRADDTAILAKAHAEDQIVLTLDLDFGYLMAASGAALPSVIIFRLGNETANVITKRLEDVLTCCEADLLTGSIIAVDDETVRVRQLPIKRD